MRLLILIGVPASGKSTFRETLTKNVIANDVLDRYAFISSDDEIEAIGRDLGKTYNEVFQNERHVKSAMFRANTKFNQALAEGKYIVLDRTNMSRKSRASYIELAKLHNYGVDAVVFERPMTDAQHIEWNCRLASREGKSIPNSVLQDMFCNYDEPTVEEGFNDIMFHNTFE